MAPGRELNVDPTSWIFPIQVLLGTVRHGEVEACSISKVPDKLRKPNKDAYVPQVVSIGPYHKGSQNDLFMMEQPKWNYMLSLLGRSLFQAEQEGKIKDGPSTVKECGETILEIEYIVRASYGGNALSEPHELAKLMLLDGFFLLEFIHRLHEYKESLKAGENGEYDDDPVFESLDKVLSVLSDLLLLENQVPFIVLKKLYRKLFPVPVPVEQDHRVATLAMEALGYFSVVPTSGAAHLLHLVYLSIVNQEDRKKTRRAHKELKRCATRLRARGVTIRQGGRSNMNQFGEIFNFEINFDKGVLEIPQFRIKKSTEVTWRNMIAWEQSRIITSCKLTSYALFFQGLICCTHDIELLERLGIIVNESGKRNVDLLKMFQTLSEGVDQMDWSYSDVCGKLNSDTGTISLTKWPIVTWHQCRRIIAIIVYYCKNWYSILIKEHIPTVWKLIGVLAAVALLGLTIAQTYYSAKSSNN
ncbi:UPF0481 protein At3g47200-like isoform X1 [Vigna umbellata]|uniref:UPF0481 protein At3g47200-like isoform X1 n=1 Tax=Vigna umbellata TaxID=87088 RepID=UPI001F5F8278|nr:UPF0481 protein At3g47200-like isoform X1 [Vigna umbellata]